MKELARVLTHSSIRIAEENRVIYVDPFRIEGEPHDADFIFVTHDHFDHFSADDIERVCGNACILIVPENMEAKAQSVCKLTGSIHTVKPGSRYEIHSLSFETVPAYNVGKAFHPESAGWVGYIIEAGGRRIYIAGDTDKNRDVLSVKCDIAMVPVGGTYTMTAKEAASLVNEICPNTAIPTHYGNIVGDGEDAVVFKNAVDPSIEVCIQM